MLTVYGQILVDKCEMYTYDIPIDVMSDQSISIHSYMNGITNKCVCLCVCLCVCVCVCVCVKGVTNI